MVVDVHNVHVDDQRCEYDDGDLGWGYPDLKWKKREIIDDPSSTSVMVGASWLE